MTQFFCFLMTSLIIFSSSASADLRGYKYSCWLRNESNEVFSGSAMSKIKSSAQDKAVDKAMNACYEASSQKCFDVSCTFQKIKNHKSHKHPYKK